MPSLLAVPYVPPSPQNSRRDSQASAAEAILYIIVTSETCVWSYAAAMPRVRVSQWIAAVVFLSTAVPALGKTTREYFVGAVEEVWDYGPGGGDLSTFHSHTGHR